MDSTNLNVELKKQKNIAIEASKMKSRFFSISKVQVEIILAPGEQLLSLINDILELSKIEAGQIKITPANQARDPWVKIGVQENLTDIQISFVDSGSGVRELDFQKMLQPFYTTKGPSVRGMGLTISKTT